MWLLEVPFGRNCTKFRGSATIGKIPICLRIAIRPRARRGYSIFLLESLGRRSLLNASRRRAAHIKVYSTHWQGRAELGSPARRSPLHPMGCWSFPCQGRATVRGGRSSGNPECTPCQCSELTLMCGSPPARRWSREKKPPGSSVTSCAGAYCSSKDRSDLPRWLRT